MLDYAAKIARNHHLSTQADIQTLRDRGFTDADILHIIYWIGHFNMANTLSDAVGREVHENMSAVFVDDVPAEQGRLGTGAGAMVQHEILRAGWEQAQVRALEGIPLEWINTPPLRWADVRGRVLVVTYWDASHPNSLLAVPTLRRWADQFGPEGALVLGCHAPEFAAAKDPAFARRAVAQLGIAYPVVHDPTFRKVQGSNNRYWPATHLIDREGFVRFRRYGPGGFGAIEEQLVGLLREQTPIDYASTAPPTHDARDDAWLDPQATPELYGTYYIGAPEGGVGWAGDPQRYVVPATLEPHRLYADGVWQVRTDGLELIEAPGGCTVMYQAKEVYLFVSPTSGPVIASVRLDDRPLPEDDAGRDVRAGGRFSITEPRVYALVQHRRLEAHRLSVEFAGGVLLHRLSFLPFRGEPDE